MEEVIKKLRAQDKMQEKAQTFAKDYFGQDHDEVIGFNVAILFAARFALHLNDEKTA